MPERLDVHTYRMSLDEGGDAAEECPVCELVWGVKYDAADPTIWRLRGTLGRTGTRTNGCTALVVLASAKPWMERRRSGGSLTRRVDSFRMKTEG